MITENYRFCFSGDADEIADAESIIILPEAADSVRTVSGKFYVTLDVKSLEQQETVSKAVRAGASGVMLSGVRNGADIQHCDVTLSVAEAMEGMTEGRLKILAMPGDNPAGLLAAHNLAGKSRRLVALGWNRELLSIACGHPSPANGILTDFERAARSMVLLAAGACGVAAIDTPDEERDPTRFLTICEESRKEGFAGKIALCPGQWRIIRQVFG